MKYQVSIIFDTAEDLINHVRAFEMTAQPPTEAKPTKKAKAAVPKEVGTSAPIEDAPVTQKLTMDDVKAAFSGFLGAQGLEAGRALLASFHVAKVAHLNPDQFPEFMSAITAGV